MQAKRIEFGIDSMAVILKDGRTIDVPLATYPTLANAPPEALRNYRLLGGGEGIHWPDLDEDLSVAGLARDFELKRSA